MYVSEINTKMLVPLAARDFNTTRRRRRDVLLCVFGKKKEDVLCVQEYLAQVRFDISKSS